MLVDDWSTTLCPRLGQTTTQRFPKFRSKGQLQAASGDKDDAMDAARTAQSLAAACGDVDAEARKTGGGRTQQPMMQVVDHL